MAITYTWSFDDFEIDSSKKVKTIHWKYTGVDGETDKSARLWGSCDGDDLDFDSMSKDNCVACVLDKNQNTLDELKANIANQISNINTPNTTKKNKTW